MRFIDARDLTPCLWLYWDCDRCHWLASTLKTRELFGRCGDQWWPL